MHLFTDYLEPLTEWLYLNPNWALFITFLISFSESLAIVGSLIPGSITMTSIGILAGSGIMRIDLTLIAATLGAIAGDGASYILGSAFSHRLHRAWPFSRHPHLLAYGKNYFAQHGGKSILLGRFVGPLRSLVPLIAGMLHMNRWYFLIANIISAIGWSILYIAPGVLIGAASSELSPESASKLFIIILLFLVSLWMTSIIIKWLINHLNRLLYIHLDKAWAWFRSRKSSGRYFDALTPQDEAHHYPTFGLIIAFLLSLTIACTITIITLKEGWYLAADKPVYLFLQSLRTQSFDTFFILMSLIVNPVTLLILAFITAGYAIFHRDWRLLKYWLSLMIGNTTLILMIFLFIYLCGNTLLHTTPHLFYPDLTLTFAASFFIFLLFYLNAYYRTSTTQILRFILLLLLFISTIGAMYLGDNWFSCLLGGFFIGLTVAIGHWIIYRRNINVVNRSPYSLMISFGLLSIAIIISGFTYYHKQVQKHTPYIQQYVLTNEAWWQQSQPILPLYTTNRIGKRLGLLNIQYAGSLDRLTTVLSSFGWEVKPNALFHTLLTLKHEARKMPFMTPLYHNKPPYISLIYKGKMNTPPILLNFWRSNYHLQNHSQPIWIGSLHAAQPASHPEIFQSLLSALCCFETSLLPLPSKITENLPLSTPASLLLIQEISL